MNIVGEKVILRAMEPEDMESLRQMTNDPEMEYLLGGWSYPISKSQQDEWYQSAVKDQKNLRWSIVRKEDNALVGMVNLVDIDWKNGVAVHGIRLISEKEYRHKGYGTDAVKALMHYAFTEMRLNRLETTILVYNEVSQALYKKCGWTCEGIRRSAVFRRGVYHDQQFWSILAIEYLKQERLTYEQ